MNTLFLVRGLPGSGKSTTAAQLVGPNNVYEADDFFTNGDGDYNFEPKHIGEAHKECQANVAHALAANEGDVAVSNTFSQKWETKVYFEEALGKGYTVVIIECQSDFGSTHDVPAEAIERMRERWEADVSHSTQDLVNEGCYDAGWLDAQIEKDHIACKSVAGQQEATAAFESHCDACANTMRKGRSISMLEASKEAI